MKLYSIRQWGTIYENNRSRELKKLDWFAMPNKQDGDGYTAIMERKNGAAILGAFVACAQIASRCDPRGTLIRDGKKPHDAASLSRMCRIPAALIQEMLEFCSSDDVNWFEISELQDTTAGRCGIAALPSDAGNDLPPDGAALDSDVVAPRARARALAEGKEGNGREGEGGGGGGEDSFPDLVLVWNAKADPVFPRVQTVSLDRKKHLSARKKDQWWMDNYEAAIERINKSDFCKGQNERGWIADFDFMLQPGKMARIMEGKYDNRNGQTGRPTENAI